MSTWAILLAAGSGTRFGSRKQDFNVDGKPLWRWSYETLFACDFDGVIVVGADLPGAIAGGIRRQDSVAAGLEAIPDDCSLVVVHDAARPMMSRELVARVIDRCRVGDVDGVVPGLPVADTIKVIEGDMVDHTPDRAALVVAQTPQAFRADVLRSAHAEIVEDVTDDASMLELAGFSVAVVSGDERNIKITFPHDLHLLGLETP